MISFYPGPSKVYKHIPAYLKDAYKEGVMSINHRSETFVEISTATLGLLKKKLSIPDDYSIFFTSSATECWEIIAQSLIEEKSFHLYNGAFGEKWFLYTQKLKPQAAALAFNPEEALIPGQMKIPDGTELICLTQNETSNGTQVAVDTMIELRKKWLHSLIAVDATSSMGGIALPFAQADIWFASVQKCFGLPAGLGLLICSPRAIERALEMNENSHYNSLVFLYEKMKDKQTSYTPNVLSIYLLMRLLQDIPDITDISGLLEKRMQAWIQLLEGFNDFSLHIKNPEVRSTTVIPLSGTEQVIREVKQKAQAEGILLGNGYGQLKKTSLRIANFSAIEKAEIDLLKGFFRRHFS